MIDRNVPRKFVADKDERLLEVGDMIEAQNITITQRGEGSGSIVKTMKGTSIKQLISGSGTNLEASVTVIGKVEDPQTNKIYFFVASDSGNDNDMIVQYDPEYSTSGGYREVFRSTWLNFDPTGFVKANVVNKAFQRDGVIQTVIYFTDNDNPPRKINVERALAGDYDLFTDSDLDIALSTIKASSTFPPEFRFETDTNVTENNFEQNHMQYATQILYTDGEESALSPYSKLAVSQAASFGGLETTSYGVTKLTQNVCIIRHNIDINHPDIRKVRLLARNGNSGGFFIIDEFDPKQSLKRDLFGNNIQVYNPNTQEYRFYNNVLGQVISDTVAQKTYDNVPLKAEGQAFVGNRLMFSNYTEGRANNPLDPSKFSITPQYSPITGGVNDFIVPSDISSMYGTSGINVSIDIENAAAIGASQSFDAGTLVNLSFNYKPLFTATATSGTFITINNVVQEDELSGQTNTGTFRCSELVCDTLATQNEIVTFTAITPVYYSTPTDLANFLQSIIDNIDGFYLDYTVEGANLTSTTLTDTTMSCTARLYFKFGETVSSSNDQILFEPRVTKIDLFDVFIDEISGQQFSAQEIEFIDVFSKPGNQQSELTYSSITNTTASESISITTHGALSSFKSGANHNFGIVYYDKYGRNGFVNELGSVYVDSPPERSSGYGPVSMKFNLEDTDLTKPSWADSYQIVYSGSSVENVFQYTVGGAYPRYKTSETGSNHDLDTSVHNIYVSLRTLDHYRRDKDVVRNYSFTEGDKLRIISHKDDSNNIVNTPLSSNSSIIEFDVVGVEVIDNLSGDPIRKSTTAASNSDSSPHYGTFLVLSAPSVEATAGIVGGVNKYTGFDWYSITNTAYNGTDASDNANYWNKEVLVEIITPKKSTSENVYYEIGERKKLGPNKDVTIGDHGPEFIISSGDVHFRPVSAKTPDYDTGTSSWLDNDSEDPEGWVYEPKYVEDNSVSDLFSSQAWDRGRAHSVFRDAAEVTRYNGITYSDIYADDTAVLKLSSFTPSSANFFDLPSENGRCSYIGSFLDDLICFQETKCSLVKVDKDVIQTGSQAGLVSLSTSVLNNATPFGGDFGTQNPESVLIRDGVGYAVDKRRAAIFRLSLQGLNPISDTDIKSFVESRFSTWSSNSGAKIVSGYDQEDDIYYVTLIADSDSNSTTLGWDENRSFWQGQYTFYPDIYASLGDKFFAAKYKALEGFADVFIHQFSSNLSNQFFGEAAAESKVTVVSNYNPSMVKQYNSISLEGDSAWTTTLESSTGQTTANLVFDKKEDAFYANVTGDTSSNSTNQYIPVGTVASVDGNVVTMTNNLRGIHIPVGYSVFKNNAGTAYTQITGSPTVSSVDRPNSKITVSSGTNIVASDKLFVANTGGITGDQIRGHYCKIKCSITPTATAKEELYSINANFVNSKANHALGQQ